MNLTHSTEFHVLQGFVVGSGDGFVGCIGFLVVSDRKGIRPGEAGDFVID
jgi:hypothetical protein